MFLNGLFLLLHNLFFTSYIENKNAFPKPLPKEEEEEYIKKAKAGDKEARDILVSHNMRLVVHIAKKYGNYNDQEDLISVGNIGLMKAINTYSPEKGTALVTYAARCIDNEILMVLRSSKRTNKNISLYDPIGRDKEGNEITIAETIVDPGMGVFEQVDNKLRSENLISFIKNILSPREYEIIKYRYGLDGGGSKTQKEISSMLSISRSYVSRIEKKVLSKIKEEILPDKRFTN
ncbi:MAG: RNA polymerase sporulation sigma factor SigK [Clostridiales bacterium]|jgi:RNA polymerase sporulation-specific sigma factor|nr:RNA polymerase sporulation sigma factor SigK [Clostridiales bacterium]